jgi:short-subunit dehydrogenase
MGGRFEGKAVFITGASSGIGAATARVFAREGAKVALFARRADRLEQLAREIEAAGGTALALSGDVARRKDLDAAVARTVEAYGGIDVVLANAGFGVSGRIADLTTEDVRRQFDVNVFGVLDTVYATLPHLRASKGRLGILSSVAGHVATPTSGAYCASKFAVQSLATTLYYELGEEGISVTILSPGLVESDIRSTDNTGHFREDWPDPAPLWLRMPVDKAAKQIVRALYKRRYEEVITAHGKLIVWLARTFPRAFRQGVRLATRGRSSVIQKRKRGGR